jgi:anti-sigma-K factor RskA
MTADDLHLLTGAYVLDSLDEVERGAFERHLAECDDCRNEVRELRETVAQIGAAEAQDPPESLRSAVFSEVDRTAQLAPRTTRTPTRAHRRWLQALAVAAIAVLAFGLGTWVSQRATQRTVVAEENQLEQIVAAPDAQMASMKMRGGAHSKVIVSPSQGKAVMMADHVAVPQSDRVYQVWLIDDKGAKHGMSTFVPDADGDAQVTMTADFDDIAAVAVTVEPAGGSPQPTSEPVGVASLA